MLSAATTVSGTSSADTVLGLVRPTLPPQAVWTSVFRQPVRVPPPVVLSAASRCRTGRRQGCPRRNDDVRAGPGTKRDYYPSPGLREPSRPLPAQEVRLSRPRPEAQKVGRIRAPSLAPPTTRDYSAAWPSTPIHRLMDTNGPRRVTCINPAHFTVPPAWVRKPPVTRVLRGNGRCYGSSSIGWGGR